MITRFQFCLLILLVLVLPLIFGCSISNNQEQKLQISAAASMTDVLRELTAVFEAQTGFETRTDFASSSVLARQIEQGRETDLYFSANRHWIDYLLKHNPLTESAVEKIAKNTLAVIAPARSKNNCISLPELPSVEGKIAMGDPSHVPAGMYGKQALQKGELWEKVKDRIVGAVDTRAALAYVEQGSVPLGIVYMTDARAGKNLRILFEIDPKFTPEINYYLAIIQEKKAQSKSRRQFIKFLHTEKARKIFKQHGFTPLK